MPRGGRRPNAGRKRVLTADERAAIRREYRTRMMVWAAADAYRRDPTVRANLEIDRKIGNKFAMHGGSIPSQDIPALKRAREKAGTPDLGTLPIDKRAKGGRKYIIAELAKEYGIRARMVTSCLNE